MTVKIITDSVSDLPDGVASELGITVIPLNVHFGTEVYRDGIDLTGEDFYHKLAKSKTLPTTSVPSLSTFSEAYDRLAEETDEILAIVLSARLTAVHEVAVESIKLMKRKCRVEVVDSRWAVMAQGMMVIAAARAANAGASLDEVIPLVRHNMHRVDMRATFDTLEYLKRGGRIGKAQALLGSVIKMHPIIGLKDGVVYPFGRERSRARALNHLYRFAMSFARIEQMAIEDATTPGDAEVLAERLSAGFPGTRIYRSKPTPVIGTHTGPGLLVLSIMGDKK